MAKFDTVTLNGRYAIRRTNWNFFFKRVKYKDLKTPEHWWSTDSKYFDDCWTTDLDFLKERFGKLSANQEATVINLEKHKDLQLVMDMINLADKNEVMKDLLDKAKTFYHLQKR